MKVAAHSGSPKGALCSLAAVCLLTACGAAKAPEEAPVERPRPSAPNAQITIGTVEPQVVGKTIVSSARVAFDENRISHVFSPVTGRVSEIVAQLGQHVKAGDTLAIITSPDMGNAVSDVYKAKPAVIQTEKELKRQKELYAAQAGPLRDLEGAQANYDQAVAELQRAQEKLTLLMKRFHTDKVSQTFPLASPIDGEVIARQINPGAEVQGQYSGGATQELYTIGRQDALWVLADVYEQDMGRVQIGAPVEVTTVAYPDRVLRGKVDWVSGALDPAMRTTTVRCTLENPEGWLKSQMYATVKIMTEGTKTLAIPRSAVLHFGDKQMVIGVDFKADRYERKPVIVDEDQVGDWVPVLHGLSPGDKIVSSGALLLSEAVN
jgi:cobalt-zinc-cadmium efflux system membrane fusion protein